MQLQAIKDLLTHLLKQEATPKLTATLPYFAYGDQTQKNKIILKNATKRLREMVENADAEEDVKESLYEHIEHLHDLRVQPLQALNEEQQTLSIFINPHEYSFAITPFMFETNYHFGNSYNALPLHETINLNEEYIVLDLSREHVRVLKADTFGFEVPSIPNMPTSIEAMYQLVDRLKSVQNQPNESMVQPGGMHGHNLKDEKEHQDVLDFFRMVDDALNEFFEGKKQAAILLAPEKEAELYDKQTRIFDFEFGKILGNYSDLDTGDMWRETRRHVLKQLMNNSFETHTTLHEQEPKDNLIVEDTTTLLKSATEAKIGRIFVSGNFENIEQENISEEQLHEIVEAVAANSGTVQVLPVTDPKQSIPVLASLRYS